MTHLGILGSDMACVDVSNESATGVPERHPHTKLLQVLPLHYGVTPEGVPKTANEMR